MPTIQQLVRKGREVLVEKSKSPDVYKRQGLGLSINLEYNTERMFDVNAPMKVH